MSDNGPQFSVKYFRKFAKEWGFSHTTSSPRYPQANGEAERAVRTVKDFLSNTADPYLAPMEYKATPFANGYSPAELLIGRKLRTIQSLSYHDTLLETDSGDHVILILLDLTSAFDTVDHGTLLSRLEHFVGIQGTVLSWFKSYLTNRTFSVRLGNFSSLPTKLACGVPQGSILAPILFTLYLLPLGTIFRKHGVSFHCYADDTQIYLPLKRNKHAALESLFACLDEVKTWFSQIFLFVNESKTEVIVFGPSENSGSRSIDLDYLAPFTSCIKNLGVFWDQGLKFDKQINAVISSCFFQLRLLSKIKSFLSLKTLEIAIHALITTRLDYCNSLYLGISKSSVARLQLVQNAAARFLKGKRKFDHVTPILKSLHWLPVHYRIEFKILLFVFKSINNLAPSYLSDLLYPYNPTRILRSGDQRLLSVPRSRLKYRGDRAFAVAGPRLWNSLPAYIRSAQSLTVFKSSLKTYFFSLAFNLL